MTPSSRLFVLTRWAKSADSRSALVGMHPRWRHVPPILSSSTRATFMPSCAARKAAEYPPVPAPRTTRSNELDEPTAMGQGTFRAPAGRRAGSARPGAGADPGAAAADRPVVGGITLSMVARALPGCAGDRPGRGSPVAGRRSPWPSRRCSSWGVHQLGCAPGGHCDRGGPPACTHCAPRDRNSGSAVTRCGPWHKRAAHGTRLHLDRSPTVTRTTGCTPRRRGEDRRGPGCTSNRGAGADDHTTNPCSRDNGRLRRPPLPHEMPATMSTLTAPGTHRSQAARAAAGLAGALLLIAALASTAIAASPQRIAAQVTDDVGAVSGGAGSVQPALDDLQRAANVQLWVWFTDTTGGLSAADFATQTAKLNGFGGNDLLLVLAMTDRAYGYWKSDAIPLSNTRLDSILSADLEPGLRSGENGAAIVATAAGIRDAIGGSTGGQGATPAPVATSSTGGGAGTGAPASGGGSPLGTLLTVLLVVAFIASLGWWFLYGRKRPAGDGAAGAAGAGTAGGRVDDIAAMKTPDLETLANQALVQTDDAVRDREQELGFAQAQFGDDEVAPFQAVIVDAKADLAAAFKLRQQLDDAIPEDAATHRHMLEELVRGCRRAQARLDSVKDEFERLREIEAKAPQIHD